MPTRYTSEAERIRNKIINQLEQLHGDVKALVRYYSVRPEAEYPLFKRELKKITDVNRVNRKDILVFLVAAFTGGAIYANSRTAGKLAVLATPIARLTDKAAVMEYELSRLSGVLGKQASQVYTSASAEYAALMKTGVHTAQQAEKIVLARVERFPLGGFKDAAGRAWTPQRYASMYMRTEYTNETNTAITEEVTQAPGASYVVVTDTGSICALCKPWENVVLSIDGSDPYYLARATVSYAESNGLFHPNCKHSLKPYTP